MWSFGGVRIYVDEDSGRQANPRVDMLNPLTTTFTTYIRQHGRDSDTRKISGHCMGNYEDLILLADGASHLLLTDLGNEGQWVIMKLDPKRKQAINKDYLVVYFSADLMEVS